MRVPFLRPLGWLTSISIWFLILLLVCPSPAFAAISDADAARQVLGSDWKHLSHRAGIIFAGTLLNAESQSENCRGPKVPTAEAANARPASPNIQSRVGACFLSTMVPPIAPAAISPNVPAVELRFRVERPIAGTEPGQILTIREWTGALSRQFPLHSGDHVLLFLYPPSRLGLTSPVGGNRGQIRLDSSGQHVGQLIAPSSEETPTHNQPSQPNARTHHSSISLTQLERAIRAARGE